MNKIKIPNCIMDKCSLSALGLISTIYSLSDESGQVKTTINELKSYSKDSIGTVRKYLKELEEKQLITRNRGKIQLNYYIDDKGELVCLI